MQELKTSELHIINYCTIDLPAEDYFLDISQLRYDCISMRDIKQWQIELYSLKLYDNPQPEKEKELCTLIAKEVK